MDINTAYASVSLLSKNQRFLLAEVKIFSSYFLDKNTVYAPFQYIYCPGI